MADLYYTGTNSTTMKRNLAKELYEKVLQSDEKCYVALARLGNIYMNDFRFSKSAEIAHNYFKRAYGIHKKDESLHLYFARHNLEKGNYETSLTFCDNVVRLNSENKQAQEMIKDILKAKEIKDLSPNEADLLAEDIFTLSI